MSDRPVVLYRIDWTHPRHDDGAGHVMANTEGLVPVERCEHGNIDPHPIEYPFNFPTSRQMCDGSPTLDPLGEADDE